MPLGGISGVRPGAGQNQQGQGANAGGESGGKEFALDKQTTGSSTALVSTDVSHIVKGKTAQIVDKKKRKRKGAPWTVVVDGEIFTVYLVAIA